ncbi:MAG TPA: class III extradiol ring-cleavage dioxygenase [Burkholderiaceae bacterium]|nr:class III extradiol ring-cleavage dioxygenase [Burkholderiaceae bacterium]
MADANTLPSLFLSHGSPMIALEPGLAGAFFTRLGPAIDATFGRPKAIVAISAHSLTREPALLAVQRHETIHDFGGFPDALYRMRYDAPGSPEIARNAQRLLRSAGIGAQMVDEGGLDHGIWTTLMFVYPKADVPVVPLAFVPSDPPARQFELGHALAPLLDEGVLVLGTGSITHNLRRLYGGVHGRPAVDAPEIPESAAFRGWMAERGGRRDWDALLDYRKQAPYAAEMHPTDEHLLPWYAAAGAGGRDHTPLRIHDSITFGALGMDAYAFGAGAAALQEALEARPGQGNTR